MTGKEKDLVLTRVFDAPRERVWKAWTDPRQVAQWWGPAGFTNPRCEVDVRPGGVLRIDMRGPDAPFEGHNVAEFTLNGKGDATHVTWAMYGPASFVSKLMGIFFSMDSMIGKDFEAGLAALKAIAEK